MKPAAVDATPGSAPVPSQAAAKTAPVDAPTKRVAKGTISGPSPSKVGSPADPPQNRWETGQQKLSEAAKAHQFQPGQSGNPGGRPKDILTGAYLRALNKAIANDPEGRTVADIIAEKLVVMASKGDIKAVQELADRLQGKPAQAMALSGPDGSGIPFTTLSPADNERRIAELLAKTGYSVAASGEPTEGGL